MRASTTTSLSYKHCTIHYGHLVDSQMQGQQREKWESNSASLKPSGIQQQWHTTTIAKILTQP